MTFTRKLIAVLAVLCLFGAQQAAFAHWAVHLGAPAVAGLESPDGEHGAAAGIDQACKSCPAFTSLCAALPSASGAALFSPAPRFLLPDALPGTSGQPTRCFDSRAPPAVL